MLNKDFCLLADGFLLAVLDDKLLKCNIKKMILVATDGCIQCGVISDDLRRHYAITKDLIYCPFCGASKADLIGSVQEQKVRLLLRVKEDGGHFDAHILDPETMLVSAILENQPNTPILNGTAIMKQSLTFTEAKDFITKNPEMWDPIFRICKGLDLLGHGWDALFEKPIVRDKKVGKP